MNKNNIKKQVIRNIMKMDLSLINFVCLGKSRINGEFLYNIRFCGKSVGVVFDGGGDIPFRLSPPLFSSFNIIHRIFGRVFIRKITYYEMKNSDMLLLPNLTNMFMILAE